MHGALCVKGIGFQGTNLLCICQCLHKPLGVTDEMLPFTIPFGRINGEGVWIDANHKHEGRTFVAFVNNNPVNAFSKMAIMCGFAVAYLYCWTLYDSELFELKIVVFGACACSQFAIIGLMPCQQLGPHRMRNMLR